ncbi:MAG TPA: murein biosynthesis integral membrane protein MurJ [Clostridiaceae bacterium]|nr:murein biosynthesis integral membrane protein MurJ [Clostridiaceae bacterium]
MKKTAVLLMILTVISKVFGFAREVTLSYFYGASNISDAYLISHSIPTVIFGFIGTAITTGYIPMYSKIEQDSGTKEANRYTNNLVNILLVICTVIIVLGLVFTEPLVKVFASGFGGETLALAVRFTKISLMGIYFTGIVYIFSGFLQLKNNFAIPAMIGFPMNTFIILSIFLSSRTDIVVLSIGSVIATTSQFILMTPFIYKKGYRHSFILNIKDENIIKMVRIVLPAIIGVSVSDINILVDKTLASRIAEGGISALNYANKLTGFVQGIFVVSILTVLYPVISRMAAENDIDGLKKSVLEAISSINLLVIPITFGAMIFSEPVVKLVYGRGAFDAQARSMTSVALFFYSIGMIGTGLRDVISRAFYSLQDTKTPVINAAISMVINIVLNLILSYFMGIGGLALATSISAIFCTVLLFISLRKKIGPFGMRGIATLFAKILAASVAMSVIAWLCYWVLSNNFSVNLSLVVSIATGAMVYFAMIFLLKVKEVEVIISALKKKMGKIVEGH